MSHTLAPRRFVRPAALTLALICVAGWVAQAALSAGSPRTPTPSQAEAHSIRQYRLAARDLVADPNTQTIYASVPSRAGEIGNSITLVDPRTGALGASIFIGSEPGKMAISDDGRFIYVALDGAAAVRRFDVLAQAADLQFPLGNEGFEGPLFVGDMAVMPGSPQTLAVSRTRMGFSPNYAGVAVYDDGVRRAKVEGSYPYSAFIDFSDSPSLLYGSGEGGLHRLAVSADGVTRTGTTSPSAGGNFQFEGGRIYSTLGQVIDPASGSVVGSFPGVSGSYAVLPDSGANRTYFLVAGPRDSSGNPTVMLSVFDQTTFQPTGSFDIPGIDFGPNGGLDGLVRWGANGLAFRTGGGQLFVIQTTLIPSSESVPTPTPTPSPTATPTPLPTPAPGQLRQLPIPAKDLIVDPNTQTIYASAGDDAGAFSHSITPIDPAAGVLGTPVFVGAGANRLAISDNGQYIYVALDNTQAIRRFDVATRTPGLEFPIKTEQTSDQFRARDISVMPGNPEVIAVARWRPFSGSLTTGGVAIFDNGVQRSAIAPGGTVVEFSPSPSVLYSYNGLDSDSGFRKMVVGPCGVAEAGLVYRIVSGFSPDIKLDNGVMYASSGRAFDPETGTILGSFVGEGIDAFNSVVATDSKAGRVYFVTGELYQGGPAPVLRAFDIKTFLPVGELRLPGVTGTPKSLVRWGEHGLAFTTDDNQTFLLEHALVAGPSGTFTPAPPPPTPTLTVTGQVNYFGGVSGVTVNVTGAFTATAVTDSQGNFTVGNIPHCAEITITPSKENYTFSPPSVHLTNPGGAQRLTFNATPRQVYFQNSLRVVSEGTSFLQSAVVRTGDLSQPATVDYKTEAGTASDRSDYTATLGTLRFAPGESTKLVNILLTDDVFTEAQETFTVRLENPSGAMFLSGFDVLTVRINDNDATQPTASPLQDAIFFVSRHYQDFLNRNPAQDAAGVNFWASQITACEAEADPQRKADCLEDRRINVSAAFFLSIEFQQTGYLVHRFYTASYPDGPSRPKGLPRLSEFLRDTQEMGRGVRVGAPGWAELLEANKHAFTLSWVARPEFVAQHPSTLNAEQFVDALFANSGVAPTGEERAAALAAYGAGGDEGRANALRSVADSGSVYNRQYNSAFVLMQYFGYLRRNPTDAPDTGFGGYNFWLSKLNEFSQPGEDVRNEAVALTRVRRAEMVKAFLTSLEYTARFGPTNFDIRK